MCVNYEHSADSASHVVPADLLRMHFQLRATGGHCLTEHTHKHAHTYMHIDICPRLYLSSHLAHIWIQLPLKEVHSPGDIYQGLPEVVS